eukprot:445053-Rhodomonas_salina.2
MPAQRTSPPVVWALKSGVSRNKSACAFTSSSECFGNLEWNTRRDPSTCQADGFAGRAEM